MNPNSAKEDQAVTETPLKKQWKDMGLSAELLALVEKEGFSHPTPVQAEGIPLALKGHDIIASAQTGSGKTASFVLPMVEKLAGKQGTYGLILSPTREIALQTQAVLETFGPPRGLRSVALIGGINMRVDDKALQTYPHILVATPGRLVDHIERGNIWLDFIQMIVLDEADRMLDMGFSDQLSRIVKELPEDRQTMLYSATFTPTVERLANKIMYEPKRVTIGVPTASASSISQRVIWTEEESKNRELNRLLQREPGTIIVFTRSKDRATRLWRSLHSSGVYDAAQIHSGLMQAHREQALADFKSGKARILIATDVAGRGIHVDSVAHVVNFDLPMEPEDYIHRIGRTGRQGETGKATTFVTERDRKNLSLIEKVLGKSISDRNDGRPSEPSRRPQPQGQERIPAPKGPRRAPKAKQGVSRPPLPKKIERKVTSE
jgi:ATP-dependent RNA helicase RhlE